MKRLSLMIVSLLAVVILAGPASATHLEDLVAAADCEGWSAEFDVTFVNVDVTALIEYYVVLADADGNEVVRFEHSEVLYPQNDTNYGHYAYGEMWGAELCGDYTVAFDFDLTPINHGPLARTSGTAAFTCECDEPGGDCFLTPGYWKNHKKNWPESTLMLGGVEMPQSELLAILKSSVRGGDMTVALAHHLIAAKLNVLNGADDSIESVIDDADAYLAMHPVFSNPGPEDDRDYAESLKDMLADYNEQGCDEEEDDGDDEADEKSATTVENTSWDGLKALYR